MPVLSLPENIKYQASDRLTFSVSTGYSASIKKETKTVKGWTEKDDTDLAALSLEHFESLIEDAYMDWRSAILQGGWWKSRWTDEHE